MLSVATFCVFANLGIDILYTHLDPWIRYRSPTFGSSISNQPIGSSGSR